MQDPKRPRSHRSRKLRDSSRRRSGSIVVLMALSFVALCGFAALATDYGQMVWRRNQLQRAVDAAALGGASQLPIATNSLHVAGVVAGQNGVPAPTYGFPDGVKQIQVSATEQVSFGFARVIGINSANVSATAIAQRIPIKGVPGNVPLAITTTDYAAYRDGTSFELKLADNNRSDFAPGTLTALDLRPDGSGKAVNQFQTDLTNGYDGTIYLDQQINSALNASLTSQGQAVVDAVTQRFNAAAAAPYADTGTNYTFPNYPDGDRRIVTLIVGDPTPANNNNPKITARAIIPVYLQTVRSGGGVFLRMRILPTKAYSSEMPGVVLGDDSTLDSGLAVVRLVG